MVIMKKTPRHDQLAAAQQLIQKKKAFLKADAGTGKTIAGITMAQMLQLPTLVICSKSKITDWEAEAEALGFRKLVAINYEAVSKLRQQLTNIKVVLIDECQNMGGYNTLKGRASIDLARRVPYAVFISATPLKANPVNLYWPLKICGAYPYTKRDFRIRYCGAYPIPWKNILVDSKSVTNSTELLGILEKCTVKLEHPKRIVEFDTNIIEVDLGIAKTRLDPKTSRQVLNTPAFEQTSEVRRQLGEIKLDLFKSYIKRHGLESKAIFFTYHRDITTGLAEVLGCPYLIGGQTKAKRLKLLQNFIQADKGYLVLSTGIGSEGLNIFNCKACYFLELSYSPATYKQACFRLVRSLDDAVIQVYYFKVKNEHADLLTTLREDYKRFYA